jgi:hypothetical protein
MAKGLPRLRFWLMDLNVWEMKPQVHFSQRCFDWEVCGKFSAEDLDWTESKCRQTQAFEVASIGLRDFDNFCLRVLAGHGET